MPGIFKGTARRPGWLEGREQEKETGNEVKEAETAGSSKTLDAG